METKRDRNDINRNNLSVADDSTHRQLHSFLRFLLINFPATAKSPLSLNQTTNSVRPFISSIDAHLRLQAFGLKLTTLSLVIDGVNQSRVFTSADSDYTLIRARYFVCGYTKTKTAVHA